VPEWVAVLVAEPSRSAVAWEPSSEDLSSVSTRSRNRVPPLRLLLPQPGRAAGEICVAERILRAPGSMGNNFLGAR
jgi:hypothetical protein